MKIPALVAQMNEVLAADFAWLGLTLASATRLYRNTAVRIALTL